MGNYICQSACASEAKDSEAPMRPLAGFPQSKYGMSQIWDQKINLEIRTKGVYYDEHTTVDLFQMQNVDFQKVKSVYLGKNAYNKEACQWISENVLKKCTSLEVVNFQRLFSGLVQTEASDLEILLQPLLESKKLVSLNLSHNPIGLLSQVPLGRFIPKMSLQVLDLTECGLFSIDGETLAKELSNNKNISLTEFHAGKNRLEGDGIKQLARLFGKQKTLEKLSLNENGCEEGLVYIIEALIECKKTIKYVNIEDNDSINMAIEPLCKFIKECLNLEHLNISKLKMRKTHFEKVYSSFIIAINSGSKLETLKWNYDFMSISRAAEQFISELDDVKQWQLKRLSLVGVFQSQEHQQKMKKKLETKGIELILFSSNEEQVAPNTQISSEKGQDSDRNFQMKEPHNSQQKNQSKFSFSEVLDQDSGRKSQKSEISDLNDQLKREFVQRYMAAAQTPQQKDDGMRASLSDRILEDLGSTPTSTPPRGSNRGSNLQIGESPDSGELNKLREEHDKRQKDALIEQQMVVEEAKQRQLLRQKLMDEEEQRLKDEQHQEAEMERLKIIRKEQEKIEAQEYEAQLLQEKVKREKEDAQRVRKLNQEIIEQEQAEINRMLKEQLQKNKQEQLEKDQQTTVQYKYVINQKTGEYIKQAMEVQDQQQEEEYQIEEQQDMSLQVQNVEVNQPEEVEQMSSAERKKEKKKAEKARKKKQREEDRLKLDQEEEEEAAALDAEKQQAEQQAKLQAEQLAELKKQAQEEIERAEQAKLEERQRTVAEAQALQKQMEGFEKQRLADLAEEEEAKEESKASLKYKIMQQAAEAASFTPDGDTPGEDTPGGDTPGGDTPGGDTPGDKEDPYVIIKQMSRNWNDEGELSESACKNMAFEWFELVDFDESLLLTLSKFSSLVTENLAVEADDSAIKACFQKLDKNGDGQLSMGEFQKAIIEALK